MLVRRSALGIALAVVAVGALLGSAAEASCRPPAPVAQNAAHADVVVYGRVSAVSGGFPPGGSVTFQVQRVLKGTAQSSIRVHVGPVPGTPTSVDYGGALLGTDHVLYLRTSGSGEYTTDACNGSHAGAPTADEVAHFGPGTAPVAASGGGLIDTVSTQAALLPAAAAIALLTFFILLLRRFAARPAAPRESGSAERV
jgi:hypothetical protein